MNKALKHRLGKGMNKQRAAQRTEILTAIERATRSLERIHDVQSRDCLPLCVLGVCDRVPDDLHAVSEDRHEREELTFSRNVLRTPRVSS